MIVLPTQARGILWRQEAFGETAAQPQLLSVFDLGNAEPREFENRDASGERFARRKFGISFRTGKDVFRLQTASLQPPQVRQSTMQRRRRGHRRGDEVRTHTLALAAAEVAVAGRGDALAPRTGVAVQADAH